MGVFGTIEQLKARIVGLEPLPEFALQLAPGVQGGMGTVSRVQIDNRHVLLCSLVASEPARLCADPDIRALVEINDKLVPITEEIQAAFQNRLFHASGLVRALLETLEGDDTVVDRIREAEAVVGGIETTYQAPALPAVQVPLKDAIRKLTTTPDNHGDDLHCYSSNYWLLRAWNAVCGGSDLEKAVARKIKVVVKGNQSAIAKVRRAANMPALRETPVLPDLYALEAEVARFCGDLTSVYSLLGEVGLDSELLAPQRRAAMQKAQQLRLEILALDIDVIASEKINLARPDTLVVLLAKRASDRRKSDRIRLEEGRNPVLDEEFEIRRKVDAAVSKPAVMEALEKRQRQIEEVRFADPGFAEQHKRQLEAEPVVAEVQAALDAISHLDARIERFAKQRARAAASSAFQKRLASTGSLGSALAHKPRLSKEETVRLVRGKLDDGALCKAVRSMPNIEVDVDASPDLRALKLDLLSGLSLQQTEEGPARELFYMQKRGERLVDAEGIVISAPAKVHSALLKRARDREAAEERLLPCCSDPDIVARFEARATKTDAQFSDPLIVLEDMYTGHGESLDNAVRKAIQTNMTSNRPYFHMLAGDFSLPNADLKELDGLKVQSGESFSLSTRRFSELFANKKPLAKMRADKLERYWVLVAFAGGCTDAACLMGRQYPVVDKKREAALRDRLDQLSSRVGRVPEELGVEIQKQDPTLRRLVRLLPGRMNECVVQAVRKSAFGGDLSFLLEVDALVGRSPTTWVGADFKNEAVLPELAARALVFLGYPSGEVTPTELTWRALAHGADISPDKLFSFVRWGQPSDDAAWSFSASRPEAVGGVDVSCDRLVTEADLFGCGSG